MEVSKDKKDMEMLNIVKRGFYETNHILSKVLPDTFLYRQLF